MINRHGPAPVCCPRNRPCTFGRPGAKSTSVTWSAPSDLSSSARSCANVASAPVTLGVPMKRRNKPRAASSLRDDRRRETSVGSICIPQMIANQIVLRTTTPAHSNLIRYIPRLATSRSSGILIIKGAIISSAKVAMTTAQVPAGSRPMRHSSAPS